MVAARRRLLCAASLFAAFLYLHYGLGICRTCYRLGNYVDFWLQAALLRAMPLSGVSDGANPAVPARRALDIARGVEAWRLLRPTHWISPPPLVLRLQAQAFAPPAEMWRRPGGAALARTLVEGSSRLAAARSATPFLWWNISHTGLLLPYLRPVLRAAVDSVPEVTPYDAGTCVVHFRVGDNTNLGVSGPSGWKPSELRAAVAAMVAAAGTLPRRPSRFEVVSGGIDHGCDAAKADCGAAALRLLGRGLRATFRSATVVDVRGATPDQDFARMARAPMLVLGFLGGASTLFVGSSYAVYAAVASSGHVRSPACFLRYDECMPEHHLSPLWRGYPHPNCARCRDPRAGSADWAARIGAARESLRRRARQVRT